MGKIISAPSVGGGVLDLSFITATSNEILSGYTGSDIDGNPIEGSMVNNPDKNITLISGSVYYIPKGYHSGLSRISVKSLGSETDGTAMESDILASKTAWVNGVKLTGSMPNQGAKTAALNAGGSYTIPAGYHNGSGKVTANSLTSQTSATAAAGDILSGKNAWVNGVKIAGSMVNQGVGKAAISSGINDKGLFYYFTPGYYPTDGYTGAWIYQALADVRKSIGYTNPATVLSGTTIAGMAGTIPKQAGTTITPSANQQTVSCSGKYMTGNVIINKVTPPPANALKKGYTYMGVTGTFEGWVLGNGIFYNNGSWGNGLSGVTPISLYADDVNGTAWYTRVAGKTVYESGQIKIYDGYFNGFITNTPLDLRGKTTICVDYSSYSYGSRKYSIGITSKKVNSISDKNDGDYARFERKDFNHMFTNNNTRYTAELDVSGINASRYLVFGTTGSNSDISPGYHLYIYKIYLK